MNIALDLTLSITITINLSIKKNFNLNTTYCYNNDIHNSKITKYKPNNLTTVKIMRLI